MTPEGLASGSRAAEYRASECPADACITCSDTAVEATVVALLPDQLAMVHTGQGTEEVSVALVTAAPGDTILVHAREAIAVVSSRPGEQAAR